MPSARLAVPIVLLLLQACSSAGKPPAADDDVLEMANDAGENEASAANVSSSTNACGGCPDNQVCCEAPLGCAGKCVPDCRLGGGCPANLACDGASGVCKPQGAPPNDASAP